MSVDEDKLVTTTTVEITERTIEEFNWLRVLKALATVELQARRGSDLHSALSRKAGNWPTCACGQLCQRLPRRGDGAPVDYELRVIGVQFSQYVILAMWPEALACFQQIEARSAELLLS